MTKEIEIQGCIEIPPEVPQDEVIDKFTSFIDANGWYFGGGFRTVIDGQYVGDDEAEEPQP